MTNGELENIINNDRDAYKEFYIEYFKKLYNYGRKFAIDTSYIEDAIQEVFLDLWANKHKLKNINSVNSYLFSSFRYILFKRIKAANNIISSEEFEGEPEFSVDHSIIRQEVAAELQAKLKKALEALTPRQREAIFLRFYQGLSYEEVAVVLNISVKATYKIMARSLSALKENMNVYTGLLVLILQTKSSF
jgi:RNA polymerase sigma factor (sigma-70 family)